MLGEQQQKQMKQQRKQYEPDNDAVLSLFGRHVSSVTKAHHCSTLEKHSASME